MALSQPTGLQVQTLEPLVRVEQSVWRYNRGDCAILTEAGATLTTEAGLGISPESCPETLVDLLQLVDDTAAIVPAQTLVTLDQSFITYSDLPSQTLVIIAQAVERMTAARAVVRVRQNVLSVAEYATQPLRIYLDGQDITDRCAPAYSVTASEGDNRTASVTYYPPSGPINITSYQGREVEIRAKIGGQWRAIFTGVVDVPTYDRETRSLRLRCSDLRNERLAREDHTKLLNLTGGIYSEVAQQKEAEGEQWVRELMKTVSGSLDYTGAGALRYRPWALGATDHTLAAGDIHYREISMDFATRSEVVNTVRGVLEYRYYRRHTINAQTGFSVPSIGLCNSGTCLPDTNNYTLPTKESIRSRDGGKLGQWTITGVTTSSPPASGWYKSGAFGRPVAYITNDIFRDTYATGASLGLTLWVSQPVRVTYKLGVVAPQSVDQFGEISGSSARFAVESNIDPSVFEAGGCKIGAENDRGGDVAKTIDAWQLMAAKEIRSGHRQNYASLRYKPKTGRPGAAELMPVEIGDVVIATSDEVTVKGFVTELTHTATATGDRYTDLKLAVSRVDSDIPVPEDWSQPDEPIKFEMNPVSRSRRREDTCLGEEKEPVTDGIDEKGVMTFVTPEVPPDVTDEIVRSARKTYQLSIPVDTFDVEVP